MSGQGSVVVVRGTSGIGREVAQVFAERGREVVITGRDAARAQSVAAEIGGHVRGLACDLARPEEIAGALADVGEVDHLVLVAIERDENSARDFSWDRALRMVTLKLVGYTEVVHGLASRLADNASIVVFGGQAKGGRIPGRRRSRL